MPILDCSALLQAKKAAEPTLLAKAFINHVLPKVVELDLQKMFLERIAKGESADVPIFTYHTTRLKWHPSTMVPHGEDRFGQPLVKLSTVAYDYNDTMLGGIPVAKAAKGDSLKLLSVILGPNIRVFHTYADAHVTDYLVQVKATLYATLSYTPLHWPEIHEKFPTATSLHVDNGVVCWEDSDKCVAVLQATRTVFSRAEHYASHFEGPGGSGPNSACEFCNYDDYICTFCGYKVYDCGRDHDDEMRQWQREE